MMVIKKILFPVDLTETETKVLPLVSSFSEKFGSTVYLLHVIEDSPQQATGNLHRKELDYFYIRSLTPPQAAGNALP